MAIKAIRAKPEHEVAYQDLVALVSKHADKMTAMEILAVAANMVGKLAAMQDQRKMTPEAVMELIAQNVEVGNKTVIDELAKSEGTRQ